MRHYRQQRLVQAADNKAADVTDCGQSPAYLSSRLTPSPEPSPPALRLGEDNGTPAIGTAFVSNLLELYRSTDIATAGDRNDLVEGKSSDNGLEGSENGSRGVPACFEESTSNVVTIANSSEQECYRIGEDNDEDLIAACSLAESLQISERTRSTLVVETKRRVPAAASSSLEQALCLGEAESITGEPTGDIATNAWQRTNGAAAASQIEGHREREIIRDEPDRKLAEASGGQTLRAAEDEYEVRAGAADYTKAGSGAQRANESRAAAAVKRRSLLAGGTAVAGVGFVAVACVSPWNVEVASFCIVAGLCLCVLGWLAATFKSQLLLAFHSVVIFCILIVLAALIPLNFHWAVQSFRALRHAYFDDRITLERSFPARPTTTPSTSSPALPTRYTTPLSEVHVTAAATRAAEGIAYDGDTLAPPSAAATAVSSGFSTPIGAHEAEIEQKTPAATAVDQPHSLSPLLYSKSFYGTTAALQPPQLRGGSPPVEHPPQGNVQNSCGSSHVPHGSSAAIHILKRRKRQREQGFTSERVNTDKVKVEASVSGHHGSGKNSSPNCTSLKELQTSETLLLPGPVVQTVGQAAELSEGSHRPRGSDDLLLLRLESSTIPRSNGVPELSEWSCLHAAERPELKIRHTDSRPPTIVNGRNGDITERPPREEHDISPVILSERDRKDRIGSTHALSKQPHPKQNQLPLRPLFLTPDEYSHKDPVVLARDVSSFEDMGVNLQNPWSASSSNTVSANFSSLQPITLPSGSSGLPGRRMQFSEVSESTDSDALSTVRHQFALHQLNLLADTSQGMSDTQSSLSTVPSASSAATEDITTDSQQTNWRLPEGIVNPEPGRCDHVPGGLLRYVHSTRRQLETYGLLCAFSRYNLWGLFNRWSIDCETGCGFKFLATKRYMWSTGFAGNAARAPATAGRAADLLRIQLSSLDQTQKSTWGARPFGHRVAESKLSSTSSVATVSSNMVNSASLSYPSIEYLHWHAALPPAKQKACLEGALNVACSVVKSHYLMLLPPLAVLLLLICFILLGIGIAALRSTLHLRRLAATKR